MSVTKSRTVRWATNVSLLEHRRDELLEKVNVTSIAMRRLEWFGHVKIRDEAGNGDGGTQTRGRPTVEGHCETRHERKSGISGGMESFLEDPLLRTGRRRRKVRRRRRKCQEEHESARYMILVVHIRSCRLRMSQTLSNDLSHACR